MVASIIWRTSRGLTRILFDGRYVGSRPLLIAVRSVRIPTDPPGTSFLQTPSAASPSVTQTSSSSLASSSGIADMR